MSVFLSKFLPQFIYPTGLIFLLLLLALVFHRRRRLRNWLLIVSLLILFLAGNRWVSTSLARSLEWRYPPLQAGQQAPVIIVLAGGTEPLEPPRQTVELNGAGDRVLYAAHLYRQGAAPLLLLCGGDIPWMDTSAASPAEDMQTLLLEMGIPKEALILETRSQNTSENAANCAGMLKDRGIDEAILVTSATHMPRAMMLFADQGLKLTPAPTDYAVTEEGWAQLWQTPGANLLTNLMPSASALGQTTNAFKEYIGMIWYRMGRGL
jgi:uncharacterized SAM-binding protein YcdF (DUF218 family)